jgi:hypothetical protein
MPSKPRSSIRRSILIASAALLALAVVPSAEATQFIHYYGGPEVCIGFTVGSQSVVVHTQNPFGASGPYPNTEDPLQPGGGWYALVSTGSGGC